MQSRLLIILALTISFGAIVLAIVLQRAGTNEEVSVMSQSGETLPPSELAPEIVVKIRYFTSNVSNPACLKIEELIRRTIEKRFAQEAIRGALIFELIDMDFPENKRYLTQFQVDAKTVVIAEYIKGVQGKWVNLQDAGLAFNNPEDIEKLIAEAVTSFLE